MVYLCSEFGSQRCSDDKLSVVDDADLLLFPVPAHPGDDGGQEGVEVRPQPRTVVLNIDL